MLWRAIGDFPDKIGSQTFLDLSEEASIEEIIEV